MFLVSLALFAATVSSPSPSLGPPLKDGYAVHYDAGVFSRVLKVRQRQGLIPYGVAYDGLASSTSCGDIGQYRYVSFRNPHTRVWSPVRRVLVADCSAPKDKARHIRTGLVVEVDYRTAQWAGFAGEGRVKARVWEAR